MSNNSNLAGLTGLGIFGIIAGTVGVAYSIAKTEDLKKTASKLDITLDKLSNASQIDISDEIIAKAVERAANRKINQFGNDAVRNARTEFNSRIDRMVRDEVSAQSKSITSAVADKIADAVSDIDEEAFKEKIAKRAEDKIIKKFDGALDGMLGNFNKRINSVTNVYKKFEEKVIDGLENDPPRVRRDGRNKISLYFDD